ncbi:class F sortase [Streptomyces sp. B6(2022)]|uniref:class F sortase n=1 Tax=Streptomyces sp. B6(2022) TaxID=3404749 RepID=UPI00311DE8D2
MFWTLVLAALLFAFGPGLFDQDDASPPGPTVPAAAGNPPAAATGPSSPGVPDASAASSGGALPSPAMTRSAPSRLKIAKIGVDAPFTDLEIGPSGALNPPPADDTNLVGWHAAGVSPGETGTAVVAGHLDTATAPAVFARLGELAAGDTFQVQRQDGSTAVFRVDSVESFDKDDFPDDRVYEDTPRALVRLITCAGAYDRTARDYTENLVVFAHLELVD